MSEQVELVQPDDDLRFKALFDCTPDAVIVADDNRRFVAANPAACTLIGRAETELLGWRIEEFFHFGIDLRVEGQLFEQLWQELIRSGRSEGQLRWFLPNAVVKDIEYRASAHCYPGQHLFIIRDITEHKRAETALRESEARLNAFMDNSPAMVIIKDTEGRYVYFNKTTERLVQATLEQLRGKTGFDRLPYDTAQQLRENDLEVFASGQPKEFIETVEAPNGETHYWLTSKFLLHDTNEQKLDEQKLIGVIAFDITESKRMEAALQESAALNLAILNSLRAQVAVLNRAGDVIRVNHAWQEFSPEPGHLSLALSKEGDNYPAACRRLALEAEPALAKAADKALSGIQSILDGKESTFLFEYACPVKGEKRWFLLSVMPLSTETGGAVVVHVDVTERRLMEEEWRNSQRMLAEAEHLAHMGSWSWDIAANTLTWSQELYRILGLDPKEAISSYEQYFERVHPDDRAPMRQHGMKALEERAPYNHYYRIIRPDGTIRLLHSQGIVVRDDNDIPTMLFGTARDVTAIKQSEEERSRLFEQVSAGREQLQTLSRRLVEVQELERRTIARELHDEVGQILTGLKLMLEMSVRQLPESAAPRLGGAMDLVSDLMVRVRELSLNLRPAMLDDLGLLPTLLWYFERYQVQTGVHVDFKHAGLKRRFASTIETAAYRIVQEALTNVARYAGVSEVTVRLWADQTTCSLKIEDHGTGFEAESVQASNSSGLAGMRERALLLQGQLSIESSHGTGTRILAKLPLDGIVERREQGR